MKDHSCKLYGSSDSIEVFCAAQIIVADCVTYMEEQIRCNRKFDIIISDVTDVPIDPNKTSSTEEKTISHVCAWWNYFKVISIIGEWNRKVEFQIFRISKCTDRRFISHYYSHQDLFKSIFPHKNLLFALDTCIFIAWLINKSAKKEKGSVPIIFKSCREKFWLNLLLH